MDKELLQVSLELVLSKQQDITTLVISVALHWSFHKPRACTCHHESLRLYNRERQDSAGVFNAMLQTFSRSKKFSGFMSRWQKRARCIYVMPDNAQPSSEHRRQECYKCQRVQENVS
eukprot:5126377-Amphidinium_carterae.1